MAPSTNEVHGIEIRCAECGGFHDAPADPAFDALLHAACVDVGSSSQRLYDEYWINSPRGRWSTDEETGVLRFSYSDGTAVRAVYNLVGSWIDTNKGFVWAWNLPHLTPAIEGAALALRAYGESRGHAVLTAEMLRVEQHDTWHLAYVAAYLSNLPGVYRAKVGDARWAYFAFDEPEWEIA